MLDFLYVSLPNSVNPIFVIYIYFFTLDITTFMYVYICIFVVMSSVKGCSSLKQILYDLST